MNKIKIKNIENIKTKEGYVILNSNLFVFLSCIICEYMFTELKISQNDTTIYNLIRSYFLSEDYSTESFYQSLLEIDSVSEFTSYFPKNKKDFKQWEYLKECEFCDLGSKNLLILKDKQFEFDKKFISLYFKDSVSFLLKAKYENENSSINYILGSNEKINSNTYFSFSNAKAFVNNDVSMTDDEFFNSCEDMIKLSEQQRNAIRYCEKKNSVILAGAGSGKTRTLSSRYLYLHFVKKVPLERMLLITFTRRARQDMQDKTIKLYRKITKNESANPERIKAKTIDSFYRYLINEFYSDLGFSSKPAFRVEPKDKEIFKNVILEIIRDNRLEYSLFKGSVPNITNSFIKLLDTHIRGSKSIDSNLDTLGELITKWQIENNTIFSFASANRILAEALVDNDDLIEKINSIYDHVLLDEFQDINDVQNAVFSKMYNDEHVSFTFVGDDDQSIYFWRGSNNEIIKNIGSRADTGTLFLNTNYRNNPFIVKAGNEILKKITDRTKNNKEIIPFQKAGSKIRLVNIKNEYSKLALEIQSLIDSGTQPGKIAVLSRMGLSRIGDPQKKPLDYVIDALKNANIPFELKSEESEFEPIYDVFKFLVYGLSEIDEIYGLSIKIIESIRVDEGNKHKENNYLTPSKLVDIVFHNAFVDKDKLSDFAFKYIQNIVDSKISLENQYDCEFEDIINKFCLHASKSFYHSSENVLLSVPLFKFLNKYSINNPLRWPSNKNNINEFFKSFENDLEIQSDSDDINTENMEAIKVSTIHSFKGLEFDVVFVIGLSKGEFPNTDKLIKERQRKEKELKQLIESSNLLSKEIEPKIKELFNLIISKNNFSFSNAKFETSYKNFKLFIKDEANLSLNITADKLDNFKLAYDDYINIFIKKLRFSLSKISEEIDSLSVELNKCIEKQALKLSPEKLENFKSIKEKELSEKVGPLISKQTTYKNYLQSIQSDISECANLYNLCSVAISCIENINKKNEVESYIEFLNYELEKKTEEERKLFYVAITRPSHILYLVYSGESNDTRYQSEFILEIPNDFIVEYDISSLAEKRSAEKQIKKIKEIYDTSNGNQIDDAKQFIESNELFSNKLFAEYLEQCETRFFNENPIFNVLDSSAREYFVNALKHYYLQDFIGYDFTTEFLFNIQRSAEVFMSEHTGAKAQFPIFNDKKVLNSVAEKILKSILSCITTPPSLEEIKKFISYDTKDWRGRLKKCGLVHYYVRSGKFDNLDSNLISSFDYKEMKNDPDLFIKSIIDISNYRNVFAHNHQPVWNGNPKEDTLCFLKNIILNFYSEDEINLEVKEIPLKDHVKLNTSGNIGSRVYSEEFGIGLITNLRNNENEKKYLIKFENGRTILLPSNSFYIIDSEKPKENYEKDAKQIFKSAIGSILTISCKKGPDIISCGTGFLIGNNKIISNAHVVTYSENNLIKVGTKIECQLYNSSASIPLNLIEYNVNLDLAMFSIECEFASRGLLIAKLPPETGDKVYVIGNTKGEGLCILDGIVSDAHRKINNLPYFMFNAGIFNGNSGGPVFNNRGEVIGVASAGDKEVPNMNYAISLNTLKEFIKKGHN